MAYFSLTKGRPIAKIVGGDYDGEIVGLVTEEKDEDKPCCKRCSSKCKKRPCCEDCNMCYKDKTDRLSDLGNSIKFTEGNLMPLPNIEGRSVDYIAGPSGSGKTTQAVSLINAFKKIFPDKDFYLFSRTNYKEDPAYKGLRPIQIPINDDLIENPIDITKELRGGTILLFDDCNTVQNSKQKKEVDKLMGDIMETGRKLGIWIVITNHLVLPSERQMARTVMNELHTMTIFPRSGSTQQITYSLKTYFGLSKKQIDEILQLPSRWVLVSKSYPQFVVFEKGCYTL